MWLRHFGAKAKSSRYIAFHKRYHEFRDTDCVELCRPHHEEIHSIYLGIIGQTIENKKGKALWMWSWKEAEELIETLRETCDRWIVTTTPGAKVFNLLR